MANLAIPGSPEGLAKNSAPISLADPVQQASHQGLKLPRRLEKMIRAPQRINQAGQPGQIRQQDGAAVIGSQRCDALITAAAARPAQMPPQGKTDNMHNLQV